MPFLLEPDTYPSVSAFFEEMIPYELAVTSVLAGILPGKVFVDDPGYPTAAILIPSNQYRVYVGGEPSAPLFAEAIQLLFQPAIDQQRYWFMVHYTTNAWKPVIEQALHGLGISARLRHYYRLAAPSKPVTSPLKDPLIVAEISQALVDDVQIVNRDLLIDEIHSESPSLEYFFHYHFGFCAQDGQKLVGWCLAEYQCQRRYELGIETIEGYQRQGIATHVAAAVIQRAFAEGATEIGWHCWANNSASIATALKLGFQKAHDYAVIICDFRLSPTEHV